jgi:hypothetical protein
MVSFEGQQMVQIRNFQRWDQLCLFHTRRADKVQDISLHANLFKWLPFQRRIRQVSCGPDFLVTLTDLGYCSMFQAQWAMGGHHFTHTKAQEKRGTNSRSRFRDLQFWSLCQRRIMAWRWISSHCWPWGYWPDCGTWLRFDISRTFQSGSFGRGWLERRLL